MQHTLGSLENIVLIMKTETWAGLQSRYVTHGKACVCCGKPELGPIVHDRIWEVIRPRQKGMPKWREILCLECMESRLGRQLQIRDCWNGPWNWLRRQSGLRV